MISYPTLGRVGRLGNHLFQIAATVGVALDHQDTYGFPRWSYEKEFGLVDCFHESVPNGPLYEEPAFKHTTIPYCQDLRLKGYFQSEKYFARHAQVIRTLLTPKGVPDRIQYRGIASLHVRRGDYLLLPDHHPILSADYYEAAVAEMEAHGICRFLVFSDDLPWCRRHFVDSRFEVVKDSGPIEQLTRTIACEHHIMANSTFSWWGAWLNPSPEKMVIAPSRWFGPGYAHYDTVDLIPVGWRIL